MDVALSLLDRSRTREGQDDASALRQTLHRAELAEAAGYRRFWVAEHHAVPGVASGAPALLIQAIADRTRHIRVGSAGVMLPNHQPIVVAEQFAMLEALHPGRIDLGVGRSLGFTAPIREALRTTRAEPDDFAADIDELRAYLDDTAPVSIRPQVAQPPPLFVLGTGAGLQVAARLGLPAVVAGPILTQGPAPFERYRADYRPSAANPEPYLVIGADILIADTEADAVDLLLPEGWAMALSRERGYFPPLMQLESLRDLPVTVRRQRILDDTAASAIVGTEDQVAERIEKLVEETGAAEVLSSASTFDVDALYASDARLARLFGVGGPSAAPAARIASASEATITSANRVR
ncbi:MsnO8 family LLM class oxidoreductase [Rhodococcus sp. F64268]|nr:MsnO8 family LLM class oxidoreductase [Rhodococcus sp. F64268]